MPAMGWMIRCRVETRNFEFETYGNDYDHAKLLMARLLLGHLTDRGQDIIDATENATMFLTDAWCYKVRAGDMFTDHDRVKVKDRLLPVAKAVVARVK